ncbi:hypothetical protein [Bradyrhizobium iriomotense]|uniref:Uncharacterized protein n=1 Tax=Bradyrhizobium iriomotense TaxID=441950 RepID=A0ABQ6BCU5_9BRAD|nr:hypothetical protein [Bradyrhizobium iriomotense]GLR91234.1 hypothetical protein GCM10007857_79510 [Bradyrhizobium iriomotense]
MTAAAPLTSLEDQIENVRLKLKRMGHIAETGRDFAAIADVEARELMPLLTQRSITLSARFSSG